MTDQNRRDFLTDGAIALTSAALLGGVRASAGESANNEIVLGAIGCGGQGSGLAFSFARQPNVRIAYVCDVDQERAGKAASELEKITGKRPEIASDLRRLLDDKSIDAVTVGTPDHWHGPATILACAAGKHVYVEKPCSHNIREGRLMVEAARRNKRIVQVGTQSRSLPHVAAGIEKLRAGAIGDVLVAKAWNSQRRSDIGHAQPKAPPPHLDYDTWVGPAPFVHYQENRLHYNWHWWYAFGTGDMGNDGVHELDIARWGLGVERHPTGVSAAGAKLYFSDDQQFPDTQYVVVDYPAVGKARHQQLIFEQRIWSPYVQEGIENGTAFYGTDGMMILGKKEGWQIFGPKNQIRESMPGNVREMVKHHQNFLDSIRSDQIPTADIEIGHLSATLCHLGNISCRLGRSLQFDAQAEHIPGDEEANALVSRQYREHWATPKGVS